jgi:hypothetical protein
MDYKKSTLSKMGDALIKAADAKAHFDNKHKDKTQDSTYSNKLKQLKEVLTKEYKFAVQNSNVHVQFRMRVEVVQKHIDYVKSIQNKKILDKSDRQIIDTLINKYIGDL